MAKQESKRGKAPLTNPSPSLLKEGGGKGGVVDKDEKTGYSRCCDSGGYPAGSCFLCPNTGNTATPNTGTSHGVTARDAGSLRR